MGQVALTLNGRAYRLDCGDGEEARLIELGDLVRAKVDRLVDQFGQVGDDRLLMMSALLLADDLKEAQERLARIEGTTGRSEAADGSGRSGSRARQRSEV